MIHEILIYPDKRLKVVSKEVTSFDTDLHILLDDMYETMVAKNGIGLAGIQIGIDKRVLIINIPIGDEDNLTQPKENTLEIINPILLEKNGITTYQEGCLSIPTIFEEVKRAKYIKVEYQDRYGKKHIIEDDKFLAIALQHEMEHLGGHLFIENLSFIKRKKFEKKWKKILANK
jgi:peptide deformylase